METESRELAAVSRGKIKAGSTDDWKSEQLFVPPLPPTNLRGCHMIRIQYDVFVSNVKIVVDLYSRKDVEIIADNKKMPVQMNN